MTAKAKTKAARKPVARKTSKNSEAIQAQKLPEPAPEIRFNPVLCIVSGADQELWAVSMGDRLKQQFAKAGLDEVVSDEAAGKYNGPVILVRGDAAMDQRLIPVLLKRPNFLLLSDDPANPLPVAASVRGRDVARTVEILRGTKAFTGEKLLARAPSQLEMDDPTSPRERQIPFARIVTAGNREEIEGRMYLETRQAAKGLITQHLWPTPASYPTRWLARLGVRRVMMMILAALAVAALWFFFTGQLTFGLKP